MNNKPKKYLYIINNKKEAGLIEFPGAFDLPEKKNIKGTLYYKTDRVRRTKNFDAIIYTEHPCTLDLSEFSIPIEETSEINLPTINKDVDPAKNLERDFSSNKEQQNKPVEDVSKPVFYAIKCNGLYYTNDPQNPTPTLFVSEKTAKKIANKIPFYKEEGYEIVIFQEIRKSLIVEGK